jgi:hypothetical protein
MAARQADTARAVNVAGIEIFPCNQFQPRISQTKIRIRPLISPSILPFRSPDDPTTRRSDPGPFHHLDQRISRVLGYGIGQKSLIFPAKSYLFAAQSRSPTSLYPLLSDHEAHQMTRSPGGVPLPPYLDPIPPKVIPSDPMLRASAVGHNSKMEKPGFRRASTNLDCGS